MQIIRIIIAVIKDLVSWFWPQSRRAKFIRLGGLLLVVGLLVWWLRPNADIDEAVIETNPIVFTTTAAQVANTAEASFVGTVRAVSEAQIQAESGGRVTSVRVNPGDTVSAGSIIATLENAAEQAAMLQAEGVYEAALATAAQSDISVAEAETALASTQDSAIAAFRTNYTTVSDIVLTTIDDVFSDPESNSPGLRLAGGVLTNPIIDSRVALRSSLPTWRDSINTLTRASDLSAAHNQAVTQTQAVLQLTDYLIERTQAEVNEGKSFNGTDTATYQAALISARSSLEASLNAVNAAKTSLQSAEEALERATVSGTSATVSAANAQVKQALGSLRSAQAALNKTILRTPIAGTVNSVSVNTGDFIQSFTPVAEVANNQALEVSIFVGEQDTARMQVGDTVIIDAAATGTITNVAPALDPTTQKTEVTVAAESSTLTNGDTVTVALSTTDTTAATTGPILAPLTAVKFTVEAGEMFIVEEGLLTSLPVEVGPVVGSLVTITAGIDRNTVFVTDARGLTPGQAVDARSK